MNETPKCPYCGGDMVYQFDSSLINTEKIIYRGYFCCPNCHSRAPVVSELSELATIEEVEDEAYLMATTRVEPKNRVLTLEESRNAEKDAFGNVMRWLEIHDIRKYAEFNHLENENGIFAASLWFDEETGEAATLALFSSAISSTVFLRQKEYGLCWRCWLRKPTKEEMEGTPWES